MSEQSAEELNTIMLADDVSAALWAALESGQLAELVPELPALRMEQDPIHKHKDVLTHTFAVVDKTSAQLHVRLAALFHDIAKPRTRSFEHGGVTFRHHEAVGAKITRKRLRALGYGDDMVVDVAELVRLSGRFKGYSEGWSDSAVRRYARDAGHLLGYLNELVRCDCTTRNKIKVQRALHRDIDDLERRIRELAEEDRQAAQRPGLDGKFVMQHLVKERCGTSQRAQLGALIRGVIEGTVATGVVGMAEHDAEALAAFRLFTDWEHIYLRPSSVEQGHRVIRLLRALVECYAADPGSVAGALAARRGRAPRRGCVPCRRHLCGRYDGPVRLRARRRAAVLGGERTAHRLRHQTLER